MSSVPPPKQIAFARLLSSATHKLRHCSRYYISPPHQKCSTLLFSLSVSLCVTVVLWALSCGTVGPHTQLCKPLASPVVGCLLLPALYSLQVVAIVLRSITAALFSGVSPFVTISFKLLWVQWIENYKALSSLFSSEIIY